MDVEARTEIWKKRLLDLGKRNRLINYRETRRSNLNLVLPAFEDLYREIILNEHTLSFPYIAEVPSEEDDEGAEALAAQVIPGDIATDRTISDQQKTLQALRSRAKTAMEEQGVNILHLAFGFLSWKESPSSSQKIVSPIVLVPVSVTIESLTDPYKLSLHEDEIVVNPTLLHKLESDFGVTLPDFDPLIDDIVSFMNRVADMVKKSGWGVARKVSLTLLSFLKINMYYDLARHDDAVAAHPIIRALCGDSSQIPPVPEELHGFDHDTRTKPIDVFQVVDADSSQLDAVLLSKRGASFVLQGPPGTGKSQTITNIISEALADGKRVLFVSEKMAALEVVYRRLSGVGLADFCLILHSHKANKKEVLQNLGDTLRLSPVAVKDDAINELQALALDREKLNLYIRQLHTQCEPLGKTIFGVNGELSRLQSAPDVLFSLEHVSGTTPSQLGEYIYWIGELAGTLSKMRGGYSSNPWFGCKVKHVTHELRHDIEANLKALVTRLEVLMPSINDDLRRLGLRTDLPYSDWRDYVALLRLCGSSPRPPVDWLNRDDIADLVDKAKDLDANKQECARLHESLLGNYSDKVMSLNGKDVQRRLSLCFGFLLRHLNHDVFREEQDVYRQLARLFALAENVEKTIGSLLEISRSVADSLKIARSGTLGAIKNLLSFLHSFTGIIRPSTAWFDDSSGKLRGEALQLAKENSHIIEATSTSVLARYEKGIFEIDSSDMLRRFRTEHTSFLGHLKAAYRRDRDAIRALRITPTQKITDAEIVDLLNELRVLHEAEEWFRTNAEWLERSLGGLYLGSRSDYVAIEEASRRFDHVSDYFGGRIPLPIRRLLQDRSNEMMFQTALTQLDGLLAMSDLEEYSRLRNEGALGPDTSIDAEAIVCRRLQETMKDLRALLQEITIAAKRGLTIRAHRDAMADLEKLQELRGELLSQEVTLKAEFDYLYQGYDTDWERVLAALVWTSKLKELGNRYQLAAGFLSSVMSESRVIEGCQRLAEELERAALEVGPGITMFSSLFEDGTRIVALGPRESCDRMRECLNHLTELEDWVDFRAAREKCAGIGLSTFVDSVLSSSVDNSLLVDAFLKRFYRLWLDAVLPNYPAVLAFRGISHMEVIRRFGNLDRRQLQIARVRLKERLISRLPNVDRTTSAFDEVGILRRELGKQRRIMPIRKLFAQIPFLLSSLKPCLMMSPLSVSLFLQSENYRFDMAIFDEASQVCTENAIGAIMRAKQVVIAGDSHQLPPTNFFNTTVSGDEYDSGREDEEDAEAFESILDEAVTVLPERPLKWHYRSRHEHLIAFSNVKIYRNSLVTFPSCVDKGPDSGVEYLYVPNGVYDRKGKRDNPEEAKRVAGIVFEHFQTHPDRSLGVITFSEAQQQAVEAAIRQRRLQAPQFESFFAEDADEPFFVKNLENVQGDERDTIVFSIGYAKDRDGVMHMNLGPLSREGGYRRLNVAITRAKFNVKLVGSILPTDLRLENTNSRGVKMLRGYIEFAIQGLDALTRELAVNDAVATESPFEESVYDFLVANGHRVATQVGCSGYRIDLAIKHPTLDGRFVLGVECDGAAYHSSRTARERDRLRQDVLEDMGWTMYRIWSTDWIKDPVGEGERLLEAVNQAIEQYQDAIIETVRSDPEAQAIESHFLMECSSTDDNNSSAEGEYGFEYYQEADIYDAKASGRGPKTLEDAIEHVVRVEGPIHVEILCKRLAPLFGNLRASAKVRRAVDHAIGQMAGRIGVVQEFLYPSMADSVTVRVPTPNGTPRAIKHISPEELAAAMMTIVSKSYGISRDNLHRVTARAFGFNRTGSKIEQALEEVSAHLLAEGLLLDVDDKLRCSTPGFCI